MKTIRIPIEYTAAEARELLEAAHTIDYVESILGASVRATCACGWRSPWLTTGWVAQEIAGRHRIAHVEHPLESRARFAIYHETCKGCNGEGALTGRDGADLGTCPFCFSGYLWTLIDRLDGYGMRYPDHPSCIRMLDTKLRAEVGKR